jgi:hypothetical protein
MKINFIQKLLLLTVFSIAIISCDSDDALNDSGVTPSNPTISIGLDFASPVMLIEDDSEYTYTVSLNETQIVDTRLYVSQIGGTADGDDYEATNVIIIPKGYLTATGSVTILSDEKIEDAETLTLQIGDDRTVNSSMTPVTISFTISNATSSDLVIGFDWAASSLVTDNAGEEIGAYVLADMRLLVTNSPYTGIFGGADGGSAETYEMIGFPDGEYLIVGDFYAVDDIPTDLDLTVTFDQIGTINGMSFDFPMAINTAGDFCAEKYIVLAKVVKTGDNYDITPVGEANKVAVEGDWSIQMDDSWGDGWDGAFLTVSINGVETDYEPAAGAGGGVPTSDTQMFSAPADASLVITYTDGAYEGEHSFVITAPNGTVTADGPSPTVGTVLDSANVCN